MDVNTLNNILANTALALGIFALYIVSRDDKKKK